MGGIGSGGCEEKRVVALETFADLDADELKGTGKVG